MRGLDKPLEAALDLARELAIKLPQANLEARQKACERRDKEDLYLQQAKACHGALARHPHVTEWWEARGFGQQLRERFLLGTNKDGTAAVIPCWRRGRVQGLIRRKLEGEPKYLYPKVEEFSGGHRPLFIPASVRSGAFLTEGIVDALALAAIGEGAIAVGGTGMSSKQLRELDAVPGPLYILPDADEEGEQAAREWLPRLYPKALVCLAEYEGKPLAHKDFADQGEAAREVLGHLRERAVDALHLELSKAPKGSNNLGAYRVGKERVLPLLLKLEDEGERDAALHDVADTLKLSIKPLRKALVAMLEGQRGSQEEQTEATGDGAPEPGSPRHERAMKVLRDRRLLSRAAVDMKKLGHVGEFAAKKLAFICAVSARSGKPIQPSTHAQSAAGKNFLWDTALSLLPLPQTRQSGHASSSAGRTQSDC
jgi:DNA primase